LYGVGCVKLQDALRELMKFQQDDESKVTAEEYEVFIDR
jgi:hypothetical protein